MKETTGKWIQLVEKDKGLFFLRQGFRDLVFDLPPSNRMLSSKLSRKKAAERKKQREDRLRRKSLHMAEEEPVHKLKTLPRER